MIIYRVSFDTSYEGQTVLFVGSKREAKSLLAYHKRNNPDTWQGGEYQKCELKPTKKGFLQFLKYYAPISNNG